MLRRITFAEDSDQSISEEEDLAPDWSENCIPLGETSEWKGGIQIQSQFEVLRDPYEIAHGTEATNSLKKGETDFSSEDEVVVPFFQDDDDFTCSPGMASISDINKGIIFNDGRFSLSKLGSQQPDEVCTWSAINKEAEALNHLTENARSSSIHLGSSYAKKPHKGMRGKAKPKLIFRFQSHREDTSSSLGFKNEVNISSGVFSLLEEFKGVNRNTNENLMAGPLIEGEMIEQSVNCGVQTEHVFGCGHTNRSMVDLLDSYQDRNDIPVENKEMMVDEGSISPVAKRELDYEEPPKALDSGSSSDDETCIPMDAQNLALIVPCTEQKTMTDKFEEVYGAKTANKEGLDIASHSNGVFGKLQQVMQSEKKKEMEFLKRMQTCGNSIDETSCISVEILSRCLEAKLIVCRCFLSQEEHFPVEENPHALNENRNKTIPIIFSTRVCDAVDLEVGNLVRIYSPWKEVHVGGRDEMIILATFFSQL